MENEVDTAGIQAQDTQDAPPQDAKQGDWAPPASQAELDRIIAARLERERAKFGDYKQLKEKAQQYDAFEESQKSEQQRLQERAESASRELEAARSEVTRLRIATRYGIAEDDFDLLGTGSEEDIERRAQRIAALQAQSAPPAVTATAKRPAENLRPGALPAPEVESDDSYPREWLPTSRSGQSGA